MYITILRNYKMKYVYVDQNVLSDIRKRKISNDELLKVRK